MEILLERSGGFAGMRRTVRLGGAALGAEDEARLRAAVARAGFFELPPALGGAAAVPDRFAYRLVVEDGGRRHATSFGEAAASDALRALVSEIEDVADRSAAR